MLIGCPVVGHLIGDPATGRQPAPLHSPRPHEGGRLMARTALTIPQGTSWGIAWPILEDGEAADLTGWTVSAQVRETADAEDVLYEWGTLRANATVSGGRVTLYVQPTDSAAWTWRRGVYDVELTSPDGTVYRISEGPVYVSPEVTR